MMEDMDYDHVVKAYSVYPSDYIPIACLGSWQADRMARYAVSPGGGYTRADIYARRGTPDELRYVRTELP
jgi:hypothetical protein